MHYCLQSVYIKIHYLELNQQKVMIILSIVINGFKTVAIFDFYKNNKSISLSIPKNMGLVLSENTVTSENIASGSVILDIFYKKKVLNIEN